MASKIGFTYPHQKSILDLIFCPLFLSLESVRRNCFIMHLPSNVRERGFYFLLLPTTHTEKARNILAQPDLIPSFVQLHSKAFSWHWFEAQILENLRMF